jgi:GTP-binding protein HflX
MSDNFICKLNDLMLNNKKSAILISLHDDIDEINQLADTLDYYIEEFFIQHRNKPDVKSYVGSEKLDEIKEYLEETSEKIELIIIDGELRPSQWFILEKELKISVYDRIQLILMIFRNNADRKEARLQVRLAELEYEKPFVKELIHRARSGEHPGLMAGGEYQVDDYYEMIKKQMKNVKQKLNKIVKDRDIKRQHRQKSGYYLISLAGYTNAGKSSLLKSLTDDSIKIEDKLFSTLSTLTRKVEAQNIPVLVTDTVGFIQRLPAWIIDAFHSTLEEIERADVVLLVVDSSDKSYIYFQKINTSIKELTDLSVECKIIIVLNKIDLITKEELENKINLLIESSGFLRNDIVCVSTNTNQNIELLLELIYKSLPQIIRLKIILNNTSDGQSFISWLHEKTRIIDISYSEKIEFIIECNPKLSGRIISECKKLNGVIV